MGSSEVWACQSLTQEASSFSWGLKALAMSFYEVAVAVAVLLSLKRMSERKMKKK